MNHEPLTLTPEEQFILACLRTEFSGSGNTNFPAFDYESFDWDRVYKKSIQWRIAPLLYKIIEKRLKSPLKNCPPPEGAGSGVPESPLAKGLPVGQAGESEACQKPNIPKEFLEKIKVKYFITCVANDAVYKNLAEISEVFNKAGIQLILLKGSHLAQFVYHDIGLRQMSDIDILVKKTDLQKAEELLLQMEYYPKDEEEGNVHLPSFLHSKRKAVEVHWTITSPIWQLNIDIEGLWKRAKTVKMDGINVLILSPEDLLLYLSLHAACKHNFTMHGLTTSCDVAAIVHDYNSKLDWNQLQARAHEWGVESYLYLTLYLSHEILGVSVPDRILYAIESSNKLSEKIILEAKRRVLFIEVEKTACSRLRFLFYEDFHPNNSFTKRMFFVFRRIFISHEKLADFYGLPQSSRVVYFYHIYRIISLLYHVTLYYVRFIFYRLTHKKEQIYRDNLDLWILNPKHRIRDKKGYSRRDAKNAKRNGNF